MKAIFLCNDKKINEVFSQQQKETIRSKIQIEQTVFCREDVLKEPEKFSDVEYIFSTWGMPTFDAAEIKRCFPSLNAIFYAAGSVQAFAKPFMENGIRVFSAWAANAIPVAEYTVAQIILANKGYFSTSRLFSAGNYDKAVKIRNCYGGNYAQTVGIIGAGMIGKLVIKMLKQYSLDVVVFDPFLSDSKAEELGVKKVSLEYIFENCSVVSNHLANNEQTQGMLNGALFERMKPFSTFLNTGRGAQVVESDLIKVLKERVDITAVLDVTFPEPPEKDSEFYNLENCVLTPHIAGSSNNEVCRMAEYAVREFLTYLEGGKCEYEVTAEMLKTMA